MSKLDRFLIFMMIWNATWMVEANTDGLKAAAMIFLSVSGLIFVLDIKKND